MIYSFNQSLAVYSLDAASDQAMVLCEVAAQKGATVRFAMPAALLDLLKMFDGKRELSEVFAAYDRLNPGKYSLARVELLVQSFLLPKSLLVDLSSPTVPELSSGRAKYIFAKVRLIPQQVIYPIAKLFGWAFDKRLLVGWLAIFCLAHLIYYVWLLPNYRSHFTHLDSSTVWLLMLLGLGGAFIHETGHASALVSYGCRQTEVGFGIYIYYPVLYTDVSEAWKLTRHQRAMIDMAGVYFQSVLQILLLGLFFINGSRVGIYFFLFTDLIMFRTMNPFLRMDGYWLVADLFGIFNLRQQSTTLIKYYFLRLLGSKRAARPPLHNLKPGARVALVVYSVLSTVFFLYICEIMIRISISYLLPVYPTRLLALWQVTQRWPLDVTKLFRLLLEMLWRTAVLAGMSIFAYRLVHVGWCVLRFLAQVLWEKFRNLSNRNPHEAVTVK